MTTRTDSKGKLSEPLADHVDARIVTGELDEAIAAQGTGPEVEPFPNQRDGKAPEHLPE